MSDESEPELPLPRSQPESHDDSSSSSSSPFRSRSPNSDIEKENIPSPGSVGKEHVQPNLDDIPYPVEMEANAEDHIEIPLPPDSSKYSPSQTLVAGDDDITSPSESHLQIKKATTTVTVLGKAQAKKRLLAFSAAKLGGTGTSTVKKISPTKASLLQRQQQQQQQQQLAIATIKEEETKMKEILAMNSILNEKLKQVNALTTNIPTQPPATAVVKPISNNTVETLNKTAAAVSASVTLPENEVSFTPALSSSKQENEKEKRKYTKNLRKVRHSSSTSRSRSNSLSRSISKSKSRSRSPERNHDRHGGKSYKKKGRRSRSISRGKERERGSGRGKDRREPIKKTSSRRSLSRSRSKEIERNKDREGERLRVTKDKDREREKHRRRSRSRSHSPDIRVRKRTSKDRERELREKEREEREREKEKEREREKQKEREREEKKEAERRAEKELDKVRKTRLPVDWTDYRQCQYRTSDINLVWSNLLGQSIKSRSRSNSRSPSRPVDILNPTPLSRSLTFHSKDHKTTQIEGRQGLMVEYPSRFNRKTKTKPALMYGFTPFSFGGLYKSRDVIYKDEDPCTIDAMKDIINLKPTKTSISAPAPLKSREWFSVSDQQFCPSDGGKGILISHLYSDEDQSREASPLPVKTLKPESAVSKKQSTLLSSEAFAIGSRTPTPDDSYNDSDSAPSPLLKRKYNTDDASSFILEKEIPLTKSSEKHREPERKKHYDVSSDEEATSFQKINEELPSRKSEQVSRKFEETSKKSAEFFKSKVGNEVRRSSETSRRDDDTRRSGDTNRRNEGSKKGEDTSRRISEFSKRGDEVSRSGRIEELGKKWNDFPKRSEEVSKRGNEVSRRGEEVTVKHIEVSPRKVPDSSRKLSEGFLLRMNPDIKPLSKEEIIPLPLLKTKASWPSVEGCNDGSDDAGVTTEKSSKKDRKVKKKKKKKHHKHKSKRKPDSSEDHDNVEEDDLHLNPAVLSKRISRKHSDSSKDKGFAAVKVMKEHRKRKTKVEVKGTDDDSQSSGTEDDGSETSATRKPKKKRPKLLVGKVLKEKLTSKDAKDKISSMSKQDVKRLKTTAVEVSVVSGDHDKLKSKKKKRDKGKEKKSRRKRTKRTGSISSRSESSDDSGSEDSSTKSSSSDEESSEGSAKGKKKKVKKKSKSSKKDKGKTKDKSPPTTDDERGDGRGKPSGSGAGAGRSSDSKVYRQDRGYDGNNRNRERESGHNRDRNQGGRHRRHNDNDDREEGELTTETSDIEMMGDMGRLREALNLSYQPVSQGNSQEQEELRQQSINPENPNPKTDTITTQNTISDSEKDTHTLLSVLDDDPFLRSILENADLSAEALLDSITSTIPEQLIPTNKSEPVTPPPSKTVNTNWSEDSEEEKDRREYDLEKKRREYYIQRSKRIDRERHISHHGSRFPGRFNISFQHSRYLSHQYPRHGRSGSPLSGHFESRRPRRSYVDDKDYLDKKMHEEGRRHVEDRYNHGDRTSRNSNKFYSRFHHNNYHNHRHERSRSPPSRRYENRRLHRGYTDDNDYLDEKLHDEGRRHVEEKEEEKLAMIGPGPMTPTGEPPLEALVKDSPPLQLNVADSTISDSELANVTASGSVICESNLVDSEEFVATTLENELLKYGPPGESYSNIGPYSSPPRRLSLDERLEMEMGVNLRDEPPAHLRYSSGPPNYQLGNRDRFGQQLGVNKFPPVPNHQIHIGFEPPHSDWAGHGEGFQVPSFGQGFAGKSVPFGSLESNPTPGMVQPPRTQSQIVQVGNVIQVLPAELPSVPITITSKTPYDRPPHLRIGASRQGSEGGVRNRIVTIKVPVVPFTIPMIPQEDMPPQREESQTRRRRKSRNIKRHSDPSTSAKHEIVSNEGKEEETVVIEPQCKEKKTEEGIDPDEIISEEEIALLKEAMSAIPGEIDEIGESEVRSQHEVGDETSDSTVYIDDMKEADEGQDHTFLGDDNEKNKKTLNIPILPKKIIEILPAPKEGILVAIGFREKTTQKKKVKFSDGVEPGDGTSPSGGEEMASPPPPSFDNMKKSGKEKAAKKKKTKVKIDRKGGERRESEIFDDLPPPASPSGPYPFCPPGILYQVCPQYAVLYAHAMAEKGFDIVFEPSTQLPYLADPKESLSKIPIVAESPEMRYIGQYKSEPSTNDPIPVQSPHFSPYSNVNYSNQETYGSRIPTIMNRQTMDTPSPTVYPLNSLQEQVNAIPVYPPPSHTESVVVDNFSVSFKVNEESSYISPLDEIPLPVEKSNNIYISPTKIPIPAGTPPERRTRTTHSRSFVSSRKQEKVKQYKPRKETKNETGQESISIPLAKIASSNIHLHGGPGKFAPINRFADYDFTPYNLNTGPSHPLSIPSPVGLPPGIDFHKPPPSLTPHLSPAAAVADHTTLPGNNTIVPILSTCGSDFRKFDHLGEAVNPSLGLNVAPASEESDTREETPPPPGTTP